MMTPFSYFGSPFCNRYSRYGYKYPYYAYNYKNASFKNGNYTVHKANDDLNNDVCENSSKAESPKDSPMFQFFGIDLYFDDVLLICLIWFLYDEGVKDESLFIALILLLLS